MLAVPDLARFCEVKRIEKIAEPETQSECACIYMHAVACGYYIIGCYLFIYIYIIIYIYNVQ